MNTVRLTEAFSIPQRAWDKNAKTHVPVAPLILSAGTEGVVVGRRERDFYGAGNKPEVGMFNVVRIDNEQWRGWIYATDKQVE